MEGELIERIVSRDNIQGSHVNTLYFIFSHLGIIDSYKSSMNIKYLAFFSVSENAVSAKHAAPISRTETTPT